MILVVVFAVLNAKGKKPKAGQAGAPQTAQAKDARAAAQSARAQAAAKATEARLRKLKAVAQAAAAEGAAMLADDDCHGGSMEHTHTGGVSRSEQTCKMAAIDGVQRHGDALPEVIDARALRRAVVMAEVLGRPRALRARR